MVIERGVGFNLAWANPTEPCHKSLLISSAYSHSCLLISLYLLSHSGAVGPGKGSPSCWRCWVGVRPSLLCLGVKSWRQGLECSRLRG